MTKYIFPVIAMLALVVGVIGLSKPNQGGLANDSIGSVRQTIDTFVNGIGFSGAKENVIGGVIKEGQNQASWKNTTGQDVYFTMALVKPVATTTGVTNSPIASSSMQILVGTSTAATIADYTAPNTLTTASLINWFIATSTASKTLNASSSISYGGLGNRNLQNVVRVANGEYLNVAILANSVLGTPGGAPSVGCASNGLSSPVAGSSCDSATSTTRGFNLRWIAKYVTAPSI